MTSWKLFAVYAQSQLDKLMRDYGFMTPVDECLEAIRDTHRAHYVRIGIQAEAMKNSNPGAVIYIRFDKVQ